MFYLYRKLTTNKIKTMKRLLFELLIVIVGITLISRCTADTFFNEIDADISSDTLTIKKDSLITHLDTLTVYKDSLINHTDSIIIPPVIHPPIAYTVIQPSCKSSTGSVILNGLPTAGWTIDPIGITGSGTNKTIDGLASGTYNLVVTDGTGYISPTITIVINNPPVTPTAPLIGDIKQPTKDISTGSVMLKGLPDGVWKVTRYPSEIVTNGEGTSKNITGLDPKFTALNGGKCYTTVYKFTVTNSDGCVSPFSNEVAINSFN
jgi:hypothetical protein